MGERGPSTASVIKNPKVHVVFLGKQVLDARASFKLSNTGRYPPEIFQILLIQSINIYTRPNGRKHHLYMRYHTQFVKCY